MIICTHCRQESPSGTEYCPNCERYLLHFGVEKEAGSKDPDAGLEVHVSSTTGSVAAGEIRLEVQVVNTGDQSDRFQVDLVGAARDWGAVEPRELVVEAGTTALAVVRLRPPSSLNGGVVEVGVAVASARNTALMAVENVTVPVPATLPPPDTGTGAASLRVSTTSLEAQPGGEARFGVTVHNEGDRIEGFEVVVGGPLAPWAHVDNSQFARIDRREGAEATVVLRLPLGTEPHAGPTETVVSVRSVTTGLTLIEERINVNVGAHAALTAGDLAPRTGRGRRMSAHSLDVENQSNRATQLAARVEDPDDQLELSVTPTELDVPWRGTARFEVSARPRARHLIGRDRPPRPFTVVVGDGASQTTVQGAMVQRSLLPWWLLLIAAAAALLLLALLKAAADADDLSSAFLFLFVALGLAVVGVILVAVAATGMIARLLFPGTKNLSVGQTFAAGAAGLVSGFVVAVVLADSVPWVGVPVAVVVAVLAIRRLSKDVKK